MRPRILLAVVLAGCGGHKHAVTGRTGPSKRAAQTVAVLLSASGGLVRTLTGDGTVESAVADGHGGWFVAGAFTNLAGVNTEGIAHLRADGSVDPTWHAALKGPRSPILAASATTAYASAPIDDTGRSTFEAFDSSTGAVRQVGSLPRYVVDALATEGSELLVAQDTGVGAKAPSCLRAYDARTGASLPGFKVEIRMQPELGCINSLTVVGSRVYVAGFFQAVDGVRRPGLARLDLQNGALDRSWSPPPPSCRQPGQPRGPNGCDGVAYGVAVAGGRVFVGAFRPGVSALSETTGAPDTRWREPPGLGNVSWLAPLGGRLFAGGDFTSSGATRLNGLALLSVTDGTLLASWHPPPRTTVGPAAVSGQSVLIGLRAGR